MFFVLFFQKLLKLNKNHIQALNQMWALYYYYSAISTQGSQPRDMTWPESQKKERKYPQIGRRLHRDRLTAGHS